MKDDDFSFKIIILINDYNNNEHKCELNTRALKRCVNA